MKQQTLFNIVPEKKLITKKESSTKFKTEIEPKTNTQKCIK